MKTLDLNAYGVQEMSINEMKMADEWKSNNG
jgi:hypothetical protein